MINAYEKLGSTLDRFQEAHLWLHTMEDWYHSADKFRWSLNVFLKAINEVPKLASNELQNEAGFPKWFRDHKQALKADPLIQFLSKSRDIVVHQKMLVPKSKAIIGITEGRGIKLGLGFPINPLEDSDWGMRRYLLATRERGDFLGLLMPDEDSLPCVEREWRLGEFDEELINLCSRAWLRVSETLAEILTWLGEVAPSQTLRCRRSHQAVSFKTYDRDILSKWLADLPDARSLPSP
jgi:hypothetical protein